MTQKEEPQTQGGGHNIKYICPNIMNAQQLWGRRRLLSEEFSMERRNKEF